MSDHRKRQNYGAPVNLTAINSPMSIVTEQVKSLRTNIDAITLHQKMHTLLITSAGTQEGKSVISANLAVAYAKAGVRTLLIDADLDRPTLHRTFGLSNERGLSSWLKHEIDNVNDGIYQVLDHLLVMPSGPGTATSTKLINSDRMDAIFDTATENLDLVIIKGPAVFPRTNTNRLAEKVDGTILVVRQDYSDVAAVENAVETLDKHQANLLGTVYNDVQDSFDRALHGTSYHYEPDTKQHA